MAREIRDTVDSDIILQYQALLDVLETVVTHHDLQSLFRDLSKKLQRVIRFDLISVVLHDPETGMMRILLGKTSIPLKTSVPEYMTVEEAPGGWVWQHQQPLLMDDIENETRFPETVDILRAHGVKTCYVLPLTSSARRLGAFGVGSLRESAYGEADLALLRQVAKQVAIAVDNAINFERARAAERDRARERDRLRVLLDVNNAVVSTLDLRQLLKAIAESLRSFLDNDFTGLALYEPGTAMLRVLAHDFPGHEFDEEGVLVPIENTPGGRAFSSRKPIVMNQAILEQNPDWRNNPSGFIRNLLAQGIKSSCAVPLVSHDRALGILSVASTRDDAFGEGEAELLSQIAGQIAIAVENALAFREIESLKNKLTEEKLYLEEEIQTAYNFEQVIGQSAALTRILRQVETVAPTDSTILILGETGTGKEVIAHSIHSLSERRDRTLVKLNCAAIPTGLLESELFGHEKGAFTGAIAQRIGRFELAHRGTLFLDEVGDIPLDLQPKLLRVLQEQEFERLGSSRTIRVDVRLIAATNSDLAQMVAERKFRSDLFYRLNVFPIQIPPLRERPEDIPLLVRFFAQRFARRMKKRIESIPAEAVAALTEYRWPGNIRELENFIERAVILSKGPELEIPLSELNTSRKLAVPSRAPSESGFATLEDAERDHIIRALKQSNWVIGGQEGAAARLGMKRTTLQSRMRKLGIIRQD